jgi:hypothetical protein
MKDNGGDRNLGTRKNSVERHYTYLLTHDWG